MSKTKNNFIIRENNSIIRIYTKQLHIKNKLNPYSRAKNIFSNNLFEFIICYAFVLLQIIKYFKFTHLDILDCYDCFRITKFARFFTFSLIRLALLLANTSLKPSSCSNWPNFGKVIDFCHIRYYELGII